MARNSSPYRSRHYHQDQAGDPEEPGQVQLHAALVDAVADRRGETDAEHRAQPGRGGVAGGVERGQQEDGRLEALPQHGQERHHHQGPARPLGQGRGGCALKVLLHAPGVLPHEDDHVGDHADGERADDGLEPFLLPLGQVGGDHL